MLRTRKFMAIVIGCTSLLYSSSTLGVTENVTATITFQTPLTLTKNSDLDFGIVAIPSAFTQGAYTLEGTTVTPSNTNGTAFIGGSPTSGSITVNGDPNGSINVNILNVNFNEGVTLSEVRCSTGFIPSDCTTASFDNVTIDGTGELTITIGAVADVGPAGDLGVDLVSQPTFDFEVVYVN